MTALLGVLLIIVQLSFCAFGSDARGDTDAEFKCSKEFWLKQYEQIESYLDLTMQPCNDFYEYACGNWRVPYQLRALHAHDTLTAMKAENKYALMQYFEQVEHDNTTYQLSANKRAAASFYSSCLNARLTMEKKSVIKTYADNLRKISKWPLLASTISERETNDTFNWEYVAAELRLYGVQTFFRILIAPNWQSADQSIFYITAPLFDVLTQHRQPGTFDEETVYLYQILIKDLLLDIGLRVRKANKIAADIIQFNKDLLTLASSKDSVVLKKPQSLHSIASKVPDINFGKYFTTLLQDFTLPQEYSEQQLIVADITYLRRLAVFLKNSNVETIANYMMTNFLLHFELHLRDDDSYIKQKSDCLEQTQTFLPHELSRVFLELQHDNGEEFLRSAQAHLGGIFDKMKLQFEEMLNATNIFDRDPLTKNIGLEKLRTMQLLLPNLQEFKQIPRNISNEDDYDCNLLSLSKLKEKDILKIVVETLGTPPVGSVVSSVTSSTEASFLTPLNVNAYYRLKKNVIEIPIGILRLPLYDPCINSANTYGGFVYILAHELLHGFDYDGLNYDQDGNIANTWNAKSIINFGVKSSCYLSERYKNAHLTINENIADSEGLRLALKTFLTISAAEDSRADNLKLFFTSFAQTWCGVNEASNGNSLHSDNKGRVNNVLANFPEFAEIYKCKLGSEMHPEEKCKIW